MHESREAPGAGGACIRRRCAAQLAVVLLFVASFARAQALDPAHQWGQWRGPLSTGEAPHADPPIRWSESEGVRFKVPLPGLGHSSPVVWGDRIFVTSAARVGDAFPARWDDAPGAHHSVPVTHRHRFVALAFARADGRRLWERELTTAIPHEGGHETASLASASPVTDGERLFAFFGSRGLYALDLDGQVLWQRDFGRMATKHAHGEGASPALAGDVIVVNWDHREQSFVVALDAKTGEERWRKDRNEVTSWATPIVISDGDRELVVVPGTERIRAYDLEDGSVVWECGGLSANVVASPVANDQMLFSASSYETRALLALRYRGARGDLTGGDRVVWSRDRGTPYVPSLLLYDDSLYFLRHYQGVLTKVDAATGAEPSGPFRLGRMRDIYASPIAAAGRLYVVDRSGATIVIDHERNEALAVNWLEDRFSASPAAVGDDLYLRGERFLYSLSASIPTDRNEEIPE